MIGYLLSRKKIRELEARLEAKEAEAEELHKQLVDSMKPGECKGAHCLICKSFMGFINGKAACSLYDVPKCEGFNYNGHPFPAVRVNMFASEIMESYLMSLCKKTDN